jgi:antitoxin PrlF
MTTATITSKGQITIPAAMRSALGVGAGDRLEFVQVSPGRYEVKAAKVDLMDLKGTLSRFAKSRPVSIVEMKEAIGDHVAADMRRINAQTKTTRRSATR